jgi:hypothetical protein
MKGYGRWEYSISINFKAGARCFINQAALPRDPGMEESNIWHVF